MIFYKTVAAGNDFLHMKYCGQEPDFDPALKAVELCERNDGAGADGTVFYSETGTGQYKFRIFNKDGGEAELSGNGMGGCAAVIFSNTDLKSLVFDTKAGRKKISLTKQEKNLYILSVEIGEPVFDDISLFPFIKENPTPELFGYKLHPVSVGNPHVVIIPEQIVSEEDLMKTGKLIEKHELFPYGTNVEFVLPSSRFADNCAEVFFYERGAGYTISSSTGSSAVYAVLQKLKHLDNSDELTISTPKGPVIVSGNRKIYIENRVKLVYKGICLS